MRDIKVLIWFFFYWPYFVNLFKLVESKYAIVCRDKSEFGFEPDYNSQEDFDKILKEYEPDIVCLYRVSVRNLTITIPDSIKVVTYCDHFHEQFAFIGKSYFDLLPENNFLYLPALDVGRFDMDNVLDNDYIKNKLYSVPFVDVWENQKPVEYKNDAEKYACDLSVVSNYRNIDYYYWCFDVSPSTAQGRLLMRFIGKLVRMVRNEIRMIESAGVDVAWIRKTVIDVSESMDMKKYVRNQERFIEMWVNAVKYLMLEREYSFAVVDWLIERGYDIKLYGHYWDGDEKYRKYAAGTVNEGSDDLRKIYKYSKIQISFNFAMGLHRRNFECIRSGGLCFQADAAPEYISSDWRHFFQDGIDIVTYSNKQELYDKIDYYLAHEGERERIIEAGQRMIAQKIDAADIVGGIFREIYERKGQNGYEE